ncbi:RNA 2',3'-cyclic phosphodiesterase [Gorillibacterium timonense]|uniref:RNA 2',3'-cyclic phosphodiesterase n=1 Tax=Gorillibacterium timonense TaxID=1689269 RepID=UPI00071DF39B|nr:RNA 2',3'-cyclic phosphodiesterase [Gorillibacterium timonense]
MNIRRKPSHHYFIALSLPQEVKRELSMQSRMLHDRLSFRKWTHPEDLHITLVFLGTVEEEKLEPIREELMEIAERHSPFALAASGLGTFGPSQNPRVLYSVVYGERDALARLAEDTIGRMDKLGFPAESRPYSPHITLARRYEGLSDPSGSIREVTEEELACSFGWTADSITLYRSHPGESPLYEPCFLAPFAEREKRENHFV